MFDWEDLRHFGTLAREGSLSAAARRLKVDHVTVARRVAALEASLCLKLVDRRPRAYALTGDGARVATFAAQMEERALALARAVRAAQPDLAGEVIISAPPALASALIAPRLRALRERHPAIHILLMGEKRDASLSRREADLAVRLSRPTEKKLVARKIGAFVFALYASPAYLSSRDAADWEFIAYDEGMEGSPQQQWLKTVAGDRPIVFRTNDLESQRAAARAGVGLAALPSFIGDDVDGLRRAEINAKPIMRDVWLVVHSDLRHAPSVRAVMDFLVASLGRS
jgi:DNA-binding transcriptional LysR family regulator